MTYVITLYEGDKYEIEATTEEIEAMLASNIDFVRIKQSFVAKKAIKDITPKQQAYYDRPAIPMAEPNRDEIVDPQLIADLRKRIKLDNLDKN